MPDKLLNKEQRAQALAWYSSRIYNFGAASIANTFGITHNELLKELHMARKERKLAGKSPEPVPIVPPAGEPKLTHADILLDCLKALETIVWQADNMAVQGALNHIKHTATSTLKKAGRLL